MLRTAILFKRVIAVKKRTPAVKARGTYTTQELTKLQRKRENEAERIFLAKIAEGRMRRKRIIAEALNRAMRKEKRRETSLLLQYEANKVKASEELERMKKMAQETPAAETNPVLVSHATPKKPSASKPRIPLRKDAAIKKAEQLVAGKNFFQMIEELKRKRDDELKLLAEKKQQEINVPKAVIAEKREDHDARGDSPDVDAAIQKEVAMEYRAVKREPKRVRQRASVLKEPKEAPRVTTTGGMAVKDVVTKGTEETFVKVDETTEEPQQLKTEMTGMVKEKKAMSETLREKPLRKRQGSIRVPKVQEEFTTTATPTPTPTPVPIQVPEVTPTPTPVVGPARPTVAQHPVHAFSLAGFNEPPLLPTPRGAMDAGGRRLSALPFLDSPMIPLRSRPLDAFLPVARVSASSPLSFPPNVQPILPTRQRQVINTGLHRL